MNHISTNRCLALVIQIALFVSVPQLCAQSAHDLIAPAASIYPQSEDSGLPRYAMAELSGDGKIRISTSRTVRRSDPNEEPKQQRVEYIYAVPYLDTQTIDGKQVIEEKFRIEKKTRMVPARIKPTTEEDHEISELDGHTYELADGSLLTASQAKKMLGERIPALLITEGDKLHPFFRSIVKSDTLVIVIKSKQKN